MLPSSKSNRITVEGARYRYIVTESGPVQECVIPLAITIQLPDNNGAYLRVLGLTARRVPEEPTESSGGQAPGPVIKSRHVARLIRLGLARGWQPRLHGPAVILQVDNSDVFAVERPAPSSKAYSRPQPDAEPDATADGGDTQVS